MGDGPRGLLEVRDGLGLSSRTTTRAAAPYRWGEDGLLGLCDREGRLCFAIALWNGRDPILKERLFGLSGPEGNHGEDVKESYFYLDSTPTHSYMKALYKYPQAEFPVRPTRRGKPAPRRNRTPSSSSPTRACSTANRYFDVFVEYAKTSPDDVLIRITVANRGPEPARLDLLPTLWFRNTWTWGRTGEGYWGKPSIAAEGTARSWPITRAWAGSGSSSKTRRSRRSSSSRRTRRTRARLFGSANAAPHVKDAFHEVRRRRPRRRRQSGAHRDEGGRPLPAGSSRGRGDRRPPAPLFGFGNAAGTVRARLRPRLSPRAGPKRTRFYASRIPTA